MAALHKLIPMMAALTELGRKLEKEGKLSIDHGDDYSMEALNYILANHGIEPK